MNPNSETPTEDGYYLPPPVAPNAKQASFYEPKNPKSKIISDKKLDQLHAQGFPKGLAKSLFQNSVEFPLRIWVVDNSGSMMMTDGHRFVETTNKHEVKVVSCSRWNELQETIIYHAEISALLHAPTVFRFLNQSAGAQQLSIADKGDEFIEKDLVEIKSVMRRATPSGITPLARHLREIRENINVMLPNLNSEGKRVAVILATDGTPSDDRGVSGPAERREFVEAMKSLEGLPVWIVIRLCTDEDEVIEYYNELDSQLELSIEVLDDFEAEAKEVFEYNPWLNYSLSLHRSRELGYHNRLFDLLDERKLTKLEMKDFCCLLFGEDLFDGMPDPEADWSGFFQRISLIAEMEGVQWNPITKALGKSIDTRALNKIYGDESACNCIVS